MGGSQSMSALPTAKSHDINTNSNKHVPPTIHSPTYFEDEEILHFSAMHNNNNNNMNGTRPSTSNTILSSSNNNRANTTNNGRVVEFTDITKSLSTSKLNNFGNTTNIPAKKTTEISTTNNNNSSTVNQKLLNKKDQQIEHLKSEIESISELLDQSEREKSIQKSEISKLRAVVAQLSTRINTNNMNMSNKYPIMGRGSDNNILLGSKGEIIKTNRNLTQADLTGVPSEMDLKEMSAYSKSISRSHISSNANNNKMVNSMSQSMPVSSNQSHTSNHSDNNKDAVVDEGAATNNDEISMGSSISSKGSINQRLLLGAHKNVTNKTKL
jgi:hypothetical protein